MSIKRIVAGVAAAATTIAALAVGAASANAEGADGTTAPAGTTTITLSGDVAGRTFNAYRLGTYGNAVVKDGAVSSVELTPTATWKSELETAAATDDLGQYGNNVLAYLASGNPAVTGEQLYTFANTLRDATLKQGGPAADGTVTGAADATSVAFSGLQPGYYLVTDGADSEPLLVGTAIEQDGAWYTSLNGQELGVAVAKPGTPTAPDKTVTGDNSGTVNIGDTLHYTVTTPVPGLKNHTAYTLTVKDVASKGLKVPSAANDFAVRIDGQKTTAFTFAQTTGTDGSTTSTFAFDLAALKDHEGKNIAIDYDATVQDGAPTNAYTNTAFVAHNTNTWSQGKTKTVHTYDFAFTKQGADGAALAGAQFTVTGGKYTAAAPLTLTSAADGSVKVHGVQAGKYTVSETKVPDGYLQSVKPSFSVDIDAAGNVTFGRDTWGLTTATNNGTASPTAVVKNVRAVTQLPLTGAAGIGMLVAAAVLLAAAAVLIAVRMRSVRKQLR
ncbi:MAG: isopeptide-forming domain-containing fimbrial protein [Bifidobacterium sp.]|nr:isopeptide-forming domain-containing fimbrial protein [Bifidobacterium sp.]